MGAASSRKSTVEGNFHWQPDGTSSHNQPQLDAPGVTGGQWPLYKKQSEVPAGSLRMNENRKDLDSQAGNDGHLESGDSEDDVDRNKLTTVNSERAKTAKSKTTVVAKKGAAKVYEAGFLFGKAGTAGLGKAVEALDTLGSSMINLKLGSGFSSGAVSKGNRIEILAFEVANTIIKGYNLKQSLSEESIKVLREDVLCSEGVQRLVSTNMAELLSIVAADKRKELYVFAWEVVRFGNQCRDPQWHQLHRYFEKTSKEVTLPRQTREEVEEELQSLLLLAQHTAELYHELNSLDRFEAEIRRKFQDDDMNNNYSRGDSLAVLRSELRSQRKNVKNLKKKSLWSKTLEEVVEKLVDLVYFLHQELQNAFGNAGQESFERKDAIRSRASETLGSLGLALHYAGIITQIDGLVARPGSVPMNTRDNLYQSLPEIIKGPLHHKLSFQVNQEALPQIKAEMEYTLTWLMPMATNTTKAHHGFGWVGEWANAGPSSDASLSGQTQFALIQTLHHAVRKITDEYLLQLIVQLHHLVCLSRNNAPASKPRLGIPFLQMSPPREAKPVGSANMQHVIIKEFSPEDEDMLKHINDRKCTLGISRSQEFDKISRSENHAVHLTKSSSHPSSISTENDSLSVVNHVHLPPVINFDDDKVKALDVMDRLNDI